MKGSTKENMVDSGHRDAEATARRSRPARHGLHGEYTDILGESPEILEVLEKIETVADTNATVLIQGETGTGKELIAYALHGNSSRSACEIFRRQSADRMRPLEDARIYLEYAPTLALQSSSASDTSPL